MQSLQSCSSAYVKTTQVNVFLSFFFLFLQYYFREQGMIVVTSRNTAFNVNNIARVGHMSASQYMHSFFLHNSSLESFKMNFMSRLIRFSVTIIIGVMFLSVFRVVFSQKYGSYYCCLENSPCVKTNASGTHFRHRYTFELVS